jgi:hypothetical protein
MSTLILKAKRLIDGSGKPPLNDPVVLVRSDKVAGSSKGSFQRDYQPLTRRYSTFQSQLCYPD